MSDNKPADTNLYFTFLLGDVVYAVDVQSVKEVLTFEPVTCVPRTAEYMKGVLNIRGTVISIIDFRLLFNIPITELSKNTSIIVTEVEAEGESTLSFGFIADAVEGVSTLSILPDSAMQKQSADSVGNQFVKKLGQSGDRFVLVLNLEQILAHIEADLDIQAKTR